MFEEYEYNALREWHRKFVDRNPTFCVLTCRCEHVKREGADWRCKIIDKINEDIGKRIDDWEQAVRTCNWKNNFLPKDGKRWITSQFLKDAHNYAYSENDYFPTHKVPQSCPFLLEQILRQSNAK